MKKDWGFSALIEYGGKRILFDTGNNSDIFAQNVKAKGVDLTNGNPSNLSGVDSIPGADRVRTSECRAAWVVDQDMNDLSARDLTFYDGTCQDSSCTAILSGLSRAVRLSPPMPSGSRSVHRKWFSS